MTLNENTIRELLDASTPGPWTVEEDDWDIIVGNAEGHRMGWGDQVRFKFEAGDEKHDTALAALAPELAAEVIRLREALEKLLGEVNWAIIMAGMIQPQTEAQQTAITLGRDLCDDLTRILEDKQ